MSTLLLPRPSGGGGGARSSRSTRTSSCSSSAPPYAYASYHPAAPSSTSASVAVAVRGRPRRYRRSDLPGAPQTTSTYKALQLDQRFTSSSRAPQARSRSDSTTPACWRPNYDRAAEGGGKNMLLWKLMQRRPPEKSRRRLKPAPPLCFNENYSDNMKIQRAEAPWNLRRTGRSLPTGQVQTRDGKISTKPPARLNLKRSFRHTATTARRYSFRRLLSSVATSLLTLIQLVLTGITITPTSHKWNIFTSTSPIVLVQAQSYPGGLANVDSSPTSTNMQGWTDNSYAKIIANAERILKSNVYIHRLLSEDQIQANYGRAHYNRKYPFTQSWHLQRQKKDWACSLPKTADDGSLKEKDTLLSVLNTLFSRFMHDKLLEYHDLEPARYVSAQVEVDLATKIPTMDLADSQLLRWMVNMVVDLHYPFNLGFPQTPEDNVEAMYNLHQDPLSKFMQQVQDDIVLPDVADVSNNDADIGEHHPFELFHQWATETVTVVCDLYRDVTQNSDTFPKQMTVTPVMYNKWKALLRRQMEQAARHVVVFLKNIAVHKAHRAAASAGKGRHHPRKHWKKDLLRNIGCALVIVPMFFWLMRQFERQQNVFRLLFSGSQAVADAFGGGKEMRKL